MFPPFPLFFFLSKLTPPCCFFFFSAILPFVPPGGIFSLWFCYPCFTPPPPLVPPPFPGLFLPLGILPCTYPGGFETCPLLIAGPAPTPHYFECFLFPLTFLVLSKPVITRLSVPPPNLPFKSQSLYRIFRCPDSFCFFFSAFFFFTFPPLYPPLPPL